MLDVPASKNKGAKITLCAHPLRLAHRIGMYVDLLSVIQIPRLHYLIIYSLVSCNDLFSGEPSSCTHSALHFNYYVVQIKRWVLDMIGMHPLPIRQLIVFLIFAFSVAGCATLSTASCKSDQQSAIQDILYFGTAMPNGLVTSADWARFLETTVTPRFPQGLTVWQAFGQWRGENGMMVRESTQVLQLMHADDATAEQSIATIVAAYKTQFQQEAILRVRNNVCVSF